MKKLLFALGGCVLLALMWLPTASARKPVGAKKEVRPRRMQPMSATNLGGRRVSVAGQKGEYLTYAVKPVEPLEFNGDVRDLPQVPSTPHVEVELREPVSTKKAPAEQALQEFPPNIPLAPMPALTQNFAGLNLNSVVTGGQGGAGWPPDVNGDVGLNHYIEGVNDSWAIYSKTGTLLAAFTENSLWSGASTSTPCNGNNQGDPIVIYDQFADRWILTNFAFATSGGDPVAPFYQCFAVSKTSDPVTGGWWLYALKTDTGATGQPPTGTLSDYPKFGNWNDGCLYMSANEFTASSSTFTGALYASLNKSDLESGAPLTAALGFINNSSSPFTMIPSNISGARDPAALPPAGTPNYFVSESTSLFAFEVRKFTPGTRCGGGGTLSAPVNVSQSSYSPASGNIVPQPAPATSANNLDSLGDQLMQKVQYRRVGTAESLWVVHSVRGSSGSTVRPQWAQLDVTGSTIGTTPVQQQIYAPDTTLYRWMGSVAADHVGNAALGYSTSSTTNFPSIAYSGRLITDPLNNLSQTETQLIAGAGSQTNNNQKGNPVQRWGDYTAMSVDPADDCTFWYTNQYYSSQTNGSSGNWQTRIGSFKFPTCTTGSCTYSLTPTNNSVSSSSTTGSVTVTTSAGCNWTATSNDSWLTITSGSSGSGNGTVNYSVAANTTTSSRTGTMTIAGQTFTVTQAAGSGSCPTTAISVGQTINGALSTNDCQFNDGSYYDLYTFNGAAGQQVAIAMSASFDTYLLLLAPDGTLLAQDDDGGGGTNSRIPAGSGFFTLPTSGTYAIAANSFAPNVTGSYTLTLTGNSTSAATVQFSSANYSFSEGVGSAIIAVTRTGDTSGSVSVDYATVDDPAAVRCDDTVNNHGAAYARCDYATTIDTLTFAPGVTTKTFLIPLIDDAHVEGNETVQLRLSNPQGATLGQSTATLTITDNDTNPNVPNPVTAAAPGFFVRLHYLDFLSREPEAGEPWSGVLNNCPNQFNTDPTSPSAGCDRILVSQSFFGSPEFQLKGYFVYRFYKLAFNRLPQYTEIIPDLRAVTGQTAQEVFQKKAAFVAAFIQRQEFVNTYNALSNSAYVTALMNRYSLASITTPDPANPDGTTKVTLTSADLTSRLNAGTLTRAQVLRAIADSDQVFQLEFNQAFVAMQYYGYLRRTPETAGYNAWLNYLNTHPTDSRTMVNGFMNSTEYRLRFGQP